MNTDAVHQPLNDQQEADRAERQKAFHELRIAVCKWWPSHMPLWNAQLATASTLLFAGVQHAIALFTMGESGSGKSMQIKAWASKHGHHARVLRVDKFTIASLLSSYGEEKSTTLEHNALFQQARHKIMITPELARLFRGRTTGILEERFGELAGWLDGEGISLHSGTHGAMGQTGDYTFVWFGGTTIFYIQVWRAMERVAQRLLFFPAPEVSTDEEVPEEQLDVAIEEIHMALCSFLDVLFNQHKPRTVKSWSARPRAIDLEINRLTDLLADGHVIGSGIGSLDAPTRPDVKHFRSRIREIVSGAVWATGRLEADETDIREIVRPIVERSMPQSRGPILLALYDGLHTIKEITARTGLHNATVDRTLNDLSRMEVARSEDSTVTSVGAPAGKWYLKRENQPERL